MMSTVPACELSKRFVIDWDSSCKCESCVKYSTLVYDSIACPPLQKPDGKIFKFKDMSYLNRGCYNG